MTTEPLTAADYRLLLSLLNHAIVAPEQRERVETWLMDQCETAQAVEDVAAKLCEPFAAIDTALAEMDRLWKLQSNARYSGRADVPRI